MRDKWTDGRLDDLSDRVGDGFRRVDERFAQIDQRFVRVDQRFDHIDSRFDSLQRVMVQGLVAITAVFIAAFAAILGLIATQL